MAAVKELTDFADVRAIVVYQETHKNRRASSPAPKPVWSPSHKTSSASTKTAAKWAPVLRR